MRGLAQGVLYAAGIAAGLALVEQLRDPTSWLRTHGLEHLEELRDRFVNSTSKEEW